MQYLKTYQLFETIRFSLFRDGKMIPGRVTEKFLEEFGGLDIIKDRLAELDDMGYLIEFVAFQDDPTDEEKMFEVVIGNVGKDIPVNDVISNIYAMASDLDSKGLKYISCDINLSYPNVDSRSKMTADIRIFGGLEGLYNIGDKYKIVKSIRVLFQKGYHMKRIDKDWEKKLKKVDKLFSDKTRRYHIRRE
jgi:hypothetical protein